MDYTQTNVLSMTGGTDFATIADLTGYVDLTTNQTIASGIKTFTTLPESSAVPTTGNQLTNKTYVDGAFVTLATTQTISGLKTFSGNVRINNSRGLILGTTYPTAGGFITYTTPNVYYDVVGGGYHNFFIAGLPSVDIDSGGLVIRTSKKVQFYTGSWIYEDSGGNHLDYNTPTGFYHSLRINDVEQLRLDATRLTLTGDMRLAVGKKVEFDATGSHYITEGTNTLDRYVPSGSTHNWFVNAIQQLRVDSSGVILGTATNNNYLYLDSTKAAYIRGNNFSGTLSGIQIGYGEINSVAFFGGTAGVLSEAINTSGLTLYRDNGGLIMGLTNGSTTCRVRQTTATTSLDITTGTTYTIKMKIGAPTILEITATGVKVAGGYLGRAGTGGAFATTYNNAYYTGAVLQAWNDATNLGNFTISDYRVKECIRPAGNVLDRLCQVEMIEYEQKDISIFKKVGNHMGFIAHQVKDLFPELPNIVAGQKDALTIDGGIQPQTINNEFTNLYLKAIQELNAKIEAQQKQIDGLVLALSKILSP